MGLFSKPKCPYCGGTLTPTGYAFPFPQVKCDNCIRTNRDKKELEDRIKKLEEKINDLHPKLNK